MAINESCLGGSQTSKKRHTYTHINIHTHTLRYAILYIAIRRVPGRVIEQQVHDAEAGALEDAFPRPFSSFPLGSANEDEKIADEGEEEWVGGGGQDPPTLSLINRATPRDYLE